MRIATYSRVSTHEQRPEVQAEALRAYASARGLEIVAEHVDHGISGARAQRPGLDALMAQARAGAFDAVACVRLDRLARSLAHLVTLAAELEGLGVDLLVTEQSIDTSSSSGRLLFHVLAALSQFERELIRERTRAGIQAAKRRGVTFGPPRTLTDHARDRLKRLHRLGRSEREIAEVLQVSKSTIHREIGRLGLAKAQDRDAA